jgi:hypothetical protein
VAQHCQDLPPDPKQATGPFLELWEQAVFELLLAGGKISPEVVENVRGWRHD